MNASDLEWVWEDAWMNMNVPWCENLKQIQPVQQSNNCVSKYMMIQTGCFVFKKLWQSLKRFKYPLKGFKTCPIIISDKYL